MSLKDAAAKKTHTHHARQDVRQAAAEDEDTTRTNVDVANSVYDAFQRRCKREGRAMTKVLRRFMERYADGEQDPFA